MELGSIGRGAWERLGYSQYMYEIVPGVAINMLVIVIGTKIWPETNPHIRHQYDEHTREVRED